MKDSKLYGNQLNTCVDKILFNLASHCKYNFILNCSFKIIVFKSLADDKIIVIF